MTEISKIQIFFNGIKLNQESLYSSLLLQDLIWCYDVSKKFEWTDDRFSTTLLVNYCEIMTLVLDFITVTNIT